MELGVGMEVEVCAGQMVLVKSVEERSKVSGASPGYLAR